MFLNFMTKLCESNQIYCSKCIFKKASQTVQNNFGPYCLVISTLLNLVNRYRTPTRISLKHWKVGFIPCTVWYKFQYIIGRNLQVHLTNYEDRILQPFSEGTRHEFYFDSRLCKLVEVFRDMLASVHCTCTIVYRRGGNVVGEEKTWCTMRWYANKVFIWSTVLK